ncbi:MAG: glycosyltransferase 87 family protein [bacterium]
MLALLLGSSVTLRDAQRASGFDFYQFWVVARLLPDRGEVYSSSAREALGMESWQQAQASGSERQRRVADYRRVLETYSTPFLYAAFRPVSSSSYDRSLDVYRILVFLGMALAVLVQCRLLRYGFTATAAALIVLLFWFEPFLSDLRVGNVNALQFCLLAAFAWSQGLLRGTKGALLGGALLGLGTMFKPNLAAVLLAILVSRAAHRRYESLAASAAGFLGGIGASFLLAAVSFRSLRCWSEWFDLLRRVPESTTTVAMGNFAPARILGDRLGASVAPVLPVLVGSLALATLWIGGRRAAPTSRSTAKSAARDEDAAVIDDMTAVAVGTLVMLLASPLVWLHYYVLAVPMLLVLLRPFSAAHGVGVADLVIRRVAPALALVGIAVTPLRDVSPSLGTVTVAIVVCASTLLLFGAGLASIMLPSDRNRPEARAAS